LGDITFKERHMWFVVWLGLSVVAGIVASSKGRSGFGFFLLAVFLSPLVGLIAAAIAKPNTPNVEASQLESGDSKRCPYCAELIKIQAIACRYCGRDIDASHPSVSAATAETPEAAEAEREQMLARYGINYDGTSYKYGGRTFDSLDEAVAYVKEEFRINPSSKGQSF
jgi:hypothetical protein